MNDFFTFARLHGLVVKDTYPSERIRRCGTEDHPTSKNGAYWWDGERGWVQRWDQDLDILWWDDPDRPEMTQERRDELEKKRREYEAHQERVWGRAAMQCRMLQEQTQVVEHNYMHRKGLGDVKVRVLPTYEAVDKDGVITVIEDALFVPMINFQTEAMVGAQLVYWVGDEMRWEKKFIPGSRLKDSAVRIGPANATEIILVEGFSTGHSVNKALTQMRLRATVLVCFNDSNMVNIAAQLPKDLRAYVFADNDRPSDKPPYGRAGERAAKATGLNYCMSPVVGEDANDLHKRAGLVEVGKLIMNARKLKKETA